MSKYKINYLIISSKFFYSINALSLTRQRPTVAYPQWGCWLLIPTLQKYDSRDVSKNAIKVFENGVSPHFREFEGCDPKVFQPYNPRPPGYTSGGHKRGRVLCQKRQGLFNLTARDIYAVNTSLNIYIRKI